MSLNSKSSATLYERVREAVHFQWDPIGVAEYPDAKGEYDGYIPGICKLLEKHANNDQVFEYLWTLETETMGLNGDRQSTKDFAIWLCGLVA